MKRLWLVALLIVAAIAAVAIVAYAANGAIPILEPAGPVALAERHVIFFTFALSGVIIVPVFIALFAFAWRYRAE
ncbi:MAG: hypothetical protein ACREGR_04180, partial [Minisyncoccia bacterium]